VVDQWGFFLSKIPIKDRVMAALAVAVPETLFELGWGRSLRGWKTIHLSVAAQVPAQSSLNVVQNGADESVVTGEMRIDAHFRGLALPQGGDEENQARCL
jgi:hypothetical protein